MTRKIARQSEVTPINTIDEYQWNERLGIAQIPSVMPSSQQSSSSLPPQSSQAPTIDYDASKNQSDMFGTGLNGEGQAIAPKTQTPQTSSTPAVSKAAAVSTLYGDVSPTPTTGESSGGGSNNNGAQSNRNNSSESLPNGPDSKPAGNIAAEEEGGAGLAADLGEAASLAVLANKYRIKGILEPEVHL